MSAKPSSDQIDTSPLLTVNQLAALLQLDRRTIERWCSAGRIPGRVQLAGRTVRFRRTEIEQWIADGCPPIETK